MISKRSLSAWHWYCTSRCRLIFFDFLGTVTMHCIALAELASLLAHQAPAIFRLRPAIPADSLTRYWIQSRHRLDQWHHGLAGYTSLENAGRPLAMQAWWDDHAPMLEEIIVSESLTRVFAAIGFGIDLARNQREVEPVTHSVYLSHLEARNRVLQLLLFGRGGSVMQAMSLNRLRRASERWTDRLLAPIVSIHANASCYAVDPQRAIAYSNEWTEDNHTETQAMFAWLSQAAMRATLAARTGTLAALPIANREVSQSIIACLQHECFDSLGLLKSLSSIRFTDQPLGDRQPDPSRPLFPAAMPSDHRKGSYPNAARWLY